MHRLRWLSVLLSLAACEKGRTVAVDLRGVTADVAVIVTLDGNDVPVRMSAPFGLDDGIVSYGQPPDWTFEGPEATLIAVGLDAAQLTAVYGPYAPRPGRPELSLARPPLQPQFDPLTPLDEIWLETAIGPNAFVIPAEGSPGRRLSIDAYPTLQNEMRLRLPVDPEPCLPGGERRLFAYASDLDGALDAIDANRNQQRLEAVARLDDRTALIGGPGLFVVRRGQRAARGRPEHDAPDVWVPGDRLWPGENGGRVQSIAMHPADDGPVKRGVVTVRGNDRSWIHQISLSDGGVFLQQTLAEIEQTNLMDIDLDAEGRYVAVARDGDVYFGGLGSTDVDSSRIIDVDEIETFAVRWTGQIQEPVVVSGDRAIYLSNATFDSWTSDVTLTITERGEITELTIVPDRTEIWAAGSDGVIAVRPGRQPLRQQTLILPPRFLDCAVPTSPLEGLRTLLAVDALAAGDGFVYASQESCSGVIAIRLQDRCISVLTPDGGPAEVIFISGGGDKQLRAATYGDGQLIMVGDEGRIVTNLPPP